MDKYLFEQKFRFYLKRSDYSQSRLARQMHSARSTINKWITGENQISYETLFQLCDLLKLSDSERAEFITLGGHALLTEQAAPTASPPHLARQSYDAILYRKAGNLRKPDRLFGFPDLIQKISHELAQGKHILLTGYGGTGKTTVAAATADLWIEQGKGPVLWLGAQASTAAILFEALLAPLGAANAMNNVTGDARIHAVRAVLAQEAVGCVILDDLQEPSLLMQIRRAIPKTVPLLVTSRHNLANVDGLFAMPQLKLADAVALLASRAANRTYAEHDYQDDPAAAHLCTQLHLHPLGIIIAGAWLKQSQRQARDLLKRMDAADLEPLTLEMPAGFRESGYETVKTVLDQTYQLLSRPAQNVCRAFGVLKEPAVTTEFLLLYAQQEEWTISDALDELVLWNFITRDAPNFFSMHDMIHRYAELRMRTSHRPAFKRLAATVRSYVEIHATAFDQLQRNLLNILYTAEQVDDEACLPIIAGLALAGFQDSHGHRLTYLAQLDRVLSAQYRKYRQKELPAPEMQQLHHLFSKRGNAYFDRADYEQAVAAYTTALDLAYTVERRAMLLGLLGKSLRFLGDTVQAAAHFQQAYQVARTDENDFALSFILEQEAHAAGYHADHQTARRTAAEQVALSEKLLQSEASAANYLGLFCALINLGAAELNLGEQPLRAVLAIHQRAAALTDKLQNEEMQAHAAWALAEVYHALGDRQQSHHYLCQALTVYEAQGKLRYAQRVLAFMAQYDYQRPSPH